MVMKKIIIIFPLFLSTVLLFSSCATINNKKTTEVKIFSNSDSVKVYLNDDSLNWYTLPAKVDVMRSKNNLMITAQKDTVQKQIEVKSRNSSAFLWGNLLFAWLSPVAYFVDWKNPKRYEFPPNILLEFDNNEVNFATGYKIWFKEPQKNLLNLKFSIPYGNHLFLNKGYDYGGTFGFLGVAAGVEFYFSDKHYLNMNLGTLTDFPFPFPVSYHPDNYSRSFATYGYVSIGSNYKRLHYDLGLQFTATSYYEIETLEVFPVFRDTLKHYKKQNNLGFGFSANYRLTKNFNLGLNYYPSFLVLEHIPKFHYSHLLFFELLFRYETNRPKKRRECYP